VRALTTAIGDAIGRIRNRFAASRAGSRWASLPARTRRLGLTFAGAGLVLVILATAAFASSPRGAPARPEPSPSASPTQTDQIIYRPSLETSFYRWTPESLPTPDPTLPSESKDPWTPGPTMPIKPGAQRPKSTLQVRCYAFQDQPPPTISNGIIYATCARSTGGVETVAIDAATGKITRKYNLEGNMTSAGVPFGLGPLEISSGSLWLSNGPPYHCSAPCTDDPFTLRVDATSGKTTLKIKGWRLAGEGLGYLWAASGRSGTTILKIDPATGKTSTIPWSYGSPTVACGSLWGLKDLSESGGATRITRVDPDSGAALATFTELGKVYGPFEIAGACLAYAALTRVQAAEIEPSVTPAPGQYGYVRRLISIGADSVTDRSPLVSEEIEFTDSTVWLKSSGCLSYPDCRYYYRRLNLTSYQPTGELWLMPDTFFYDRFFEAGGWIWIYDDERTLSRTAIPASEPNPTPTPEPSVSPAATPDPTPSA
jgi:hypothetical protein